VLPGFGGQQISGCGLPLRVLQYYVGSELSRQFDDAMLSVQEDGEFDRLKRKWFGTGA